MNNLLSQLLLNLAEKEAAEKELHAKVESLEVLVAAIISTLSREKSAEVIEKIESALADIARNNGGAMKSDLELLSHNIARITSVATR
ncbi:anti-adapter protein [Affinibrenneria salicis]|uniref:Anti-adapter protein n=1 Tax=Affinibrenneria salicis TaxID=2590031 RepID=A0A5J5FT39_9GAMM|nr:sigma-S stabilization anti-adapter protein IraP [Affinibrenneria salicis]KAA8996611.1 anti-adapter protein [Affinibrenneria salicis]